MPGSKRMRVERRHLAALLCSALVLAVMAGCASPGGGDGAPARPPDVSNVPDAVPQPEPRSRRGNPPVYEVMGRRYYVMNDARGYRERGVASWYGTKFHGRLTSSGEPYDMYAMTAAHKTLPLPAYVRVTHVENGRSVVVRVNDRGPFVGERIIDLSYAAAVRLGMHDHGTALVDVELLEPGATAAPARTVASGPGAPSRDAAPAWLQVGAFSDAGNAARLEQQLKGQGIGEVVTVADRELPRSVYRVRIGPLVGLDQVERMLDRVRALGIFDAHLVTH